MERVSVIILSAGKGERLWPLTTFTPKPLLPVLCKPLIDHHLEALSNSGLKSFFIVTHHQLQKIREHVNKNWGNKNITLIDQIHLLGTGDAVKKALVKTGSQKILVVYGDIFIPPVKYFEVVKDFLKKDENLILGARVENPGRYGVLVTDDKGYLTNIIEKPVENPPSNIVNAGLIVMDKEIIGKALNHVSFSPRGELELTDAIKWAIKKIDVKLVSLGLNEWIDVGLPWDYMEANKRMLYNKCKTERMDLKNCILGKDFEVKEPSFIEGPVFIGNDAVIGPFSHIRSETIICSGVKIGFSSQVKASVLMNQSKIPHLNYVGDSIIGSHTNLGAGTITANLRHDDKPVKTVIKGKLVTTGRRKFGAVLGEFVKTGINTSLGPGVKIGAYSWIDSGCIIKRDVPDNTLVRCVKGKMIYEKRIQNALNNG